MQTEQEQPLILTLRFNAESQAFFDQERELYFPPERNFLKAHLTLFHQLPNNQQTISLLKNVRQVPFKIEVTGLMNLGGGVAYRVASIALIALHKHLGSIFAYALIPQDKQPFRPHITIQNKASPQQAKKFLTEKVAMFKPFQIGATGLDVWVYLGGPWQHEVFYPF